VLAISRHFCCLLLFPPYLLSLIFPYFLYLSTMATSSRPKPPRKGMADPATRYVDTHIAATYALPHPLCPLLFPRCSRPAWSGPRASPTFSPANTTSRLPNGPPAPQGGFPPLPAHTNGTRSPDAPQDRVLQILAGLTVRLTYPAVSHVTSLHLPFQTRAQLSPC